MSVKLAGHRSMRLLLVCKCQPRGQDLTQIFHTIGDSALRLAEGQPHVSSIYSLGRMHIHANCFQKNYSSAPVSFHRVCDNASPLPEAATARKENARQQILGGRCGSISCLNKTSDLALKNACHTYKWKLLPCIVQCWHLNSVH